MYSPIPTDRERNVPAFEVERSLLCVDENEEGEICWLVSAPVKVEVVAQRDAKCRG